MTQVEVLLRSINVLEELGIPYMLTGALAVNFYGRPRMTHDIDVVVQVRGEHIAGIVGRFAPDFYIAQEGIEDALVHKTMFNAIHHDTGMKVDFWQLGDEAYDRERFERRVAREVFDRRMFLPTAEDVIITKLDWYRQSNQERHLEDAIGVRQVQEGRLDKAYLMGWCQRLSLSDLAGEVWDRPGG